MKFILKNRLGAMLSELRITSNGCFDAWTEDLSEALFFNSELDALTVADFYGDIMNGIYIVDIVGDSTPSSTWE